MPVQQINVVIPNEQTAGAVETNVNTNETQGANEVTAPGVTAQPQVTDGVDTGGPRVQFQKSDLPPSMGGEENLAKLNHALEVIEENFGPAGHAAVSETVTEYLENPTAFASPDALLQSLEQNLAEQLEKHKVAVPSGAFNALEAEQLGQSKPTESGANLQPGGGGNGLNPTAPKPTTMAPTETTGGATPTETTAGAGGDTPIYGPGGSGGGTTQEIQSKFWPILGDMNGADIESLAFLVMMQAAKSAQEDLKAIMARVKAINAAKAEQRKVHSELQTLAAKYANLTASQQIPSDGHKTSFTRFTADENSANGVKPLDGAYTLPSPCKKSDIDAKVDAAKGDLDSMSEMGEMESLRLQMAMDRLSKMMSTLSNILKKLSDTAQAITQNIK